MSTVRRCKMSSEKEAVLKPGYVSWRTFLNFFDTLKADGVPRRFDFSILPSMSGNRISQVKLTLLFLMLIIEKKKKNNSFAIDPRLGQLANADTDERKAILEGIIKEAYTFLFSDGFVLKSATASQFSNKFEAFGLGGDTRTRAEAFFLNAAKFSNIEVSNYITNNRNTRKRRKTKPKTSTVKSNGKQEQVTTPAQKPEIPPARQESLDLLNGKYGMLHKLQIDHLPGNGTWTVSEKEEYFTAYTALLNMLVKVVDDEDYGDYDEDDDYE